MRGKSYRGKLWAMMAMAVRVVIGSVVIGTVLARAADAPPDLERQLAARAEQFSLEGRKGPSLFQPGFGVGEYTGWATSSTQRTDLAGIFSSAKASASFQFQRPDIAPVTGQCQGGQGSIGLVGLRSSTTA